GLDAETRPAPQGLRRHPPRPRWAPRPLRRHALRAARRLLPGAVPLPPLMTRVAVLGSTGSVGTQALAVIRGHRDQYDVVALAAGRNTELLAAQAAEF